MKKFIVLMMGLGFSMGAMADGGNTNFGTTGETTTIGITGSTANPDFECQALNEDVTINTSANVRGYVDCPSTYTIAVATCHEAGRLDANTNTVNIYKGSSDGGSIAPDTTQGACDDSTTQTVAQSAS